MSGETSFMGGLELENVFIGIMKEVTAKCKIEKVKEWLQSKP